MLARKFLNKTAFQIALIFIPVQLVGQLQANEPLTESFGQLRLVENLEMKTARFGFGFTYDGSKIFIANGSVIKDPFRGDIEFYDIENDTWNTSDVSLGRKRYASLEIVDNKLYIFNGIFRRSLIDSLEIVDLENTTVSVVRGSPSSARYGGSATFNKEVYSFGGSYDQYRFSDRLFKYNPESKRWIELARMPEQKETQGVFVDGILYTVGGYGFRGKTSNKIHSYDPKANEWKLFATLPYGLSANALAKNENTIWIAGDYVNLGFIASLNVATKKLTVYKSDEFIGRRHAGVVHHKGRLIVFGGNTNADRESSLRIMQVFEIL